MPKQEDITTSFKVDVSDFKKGITEVTKQIQLVNAQFKASSSKMDDWSKSSAGVSEKLKQLGTLLTLETSKLKNYEGQLRAQKDAYNENEKRIELLKNKLKELAEQGVSKTSDEYKKYQKALNDCEKEQEKNQKSINDLNITFTNQQGKVNEIQRDINKYNNTLSDLQQEERKSAEEAKKSGNAYNTLKKTISSQEEKLEALKKEYANVVLEQGKNSTSAKNLAKDIDKLSTELKNNKTKLNEVDKSANSVDKSLDKAGESAKTASEGFTVLKGVLASLTSQLISSAISGLKKLGTEVLNVGKQAITSYGGYEQLVGGVDTLFKESSKIVQGYANNAYKTAGISANNYMETVTSFSASLLQSLGGDTKKSADMANMAIIDMADNANKMGTDMTSIQNAYQGFAKQNYTMLDNLKLGYGGTKTEMERLIADANKVKKANGEMANLSISKFSDMVEAIHIIQTQMDITGTTAKEANETIQGSLNSMKSAWQNLLTGMADDTQNFDKLMDNFIESVITAGKNLIPRIEQVINGLSNLASGIVEKVFPQVIEKGLQTITNILPKVANLGIQIVSSLISGILESLPQLLSAFIDMIDNLIQGLKTILPNLINEIVDTIPKIVQVLYEGAPKLLEGAIEFFTSIVDALPTVIEKVLDAIPKLIEDIVNSFIKGIPILSKGIIKLVKSIEKALPKIIPIIKNAIPKIINTIVNGLSTYYPILYESAIELLMALLDAIPEIWPLLTEASVEIIEILAEAFVKNAPILGESFIKISDTIIKALPKIIGAIVKALPALLETAFVNFTAPIIAIFSVLGETIKEYINPIVEWINTDFIQPVINYFTDLWNKVVEIFDNIVTSIKDFITPIANWINDNLIQPIISFFMDYIYPIIDKVSEMITKIIEILVALATFVGNWIKDNIVKPIVDKVKEIYEKVSECAQKAWDKVKEIWDKVATWFNDNVITPISNFFEGLWNGITETFKNVKQWFSDRFGEAWNAIKDKFSEWGNFWSGLWEEVKNKFSGIGTNIGDAIGNGVKTALNKVLDLIEGTMNKAVRLINGAIDVINNLPGVSVGKISELNLPRLERGIGVTKKGHPYLLEGSGAEAVVPLDKNKYWIKNVAGTMLKQLGLNNSTNNINNSNLTKNNVTNFTQNIYAPKQPSRIELYRQTRNLLNYAKGGVLDV